MGKKKAAGKAERCPVAGCKTQLVDAKRCQCTKCNIFVCPEHKYPNDHACMQGKVKGSDAPPAAPTPGELKVVSGAGKAEKDNSAKEEELLSKLLATGSEELLKELASVGSAAARYDSAVIVQAMGADSKAVQKALNGAVGSGIVSAAQEAGQVATLATSLVGRLKAIGGGKVSGAEEKRAIGLASMTGQLVAAMEESERATLAEAAREACHTTSEKLARTIGGSIMRPAVAAQVAAGGEEAAVALLDTLCEQALALGEEEEAKRNEAVYAGAAVGAALGADVAGQRVVDRLTPALGKPKDTGPLVGAMKLATQLCKDLGPGFTAFLTRNDWLERGLEKVYEKATAGGRTATKKALVQLADKIGPRGIRLSVPVLLNTLESGSSWRSKALALQLLGVLGKRKVSQLFRDMPIIVPAVMECVKDTKQQVSDAASDALDNLGAVITNAETLGLMKWLLDALKNPEKVEACLDELMDCTFVNSIDAQSLALIIPIVLRGLREGSAEVKLKASITAGNVCSLVADVHDMRPFYSQLAPELKKLQDHSRPRVREHALKALESLKEDMGMTRRRSSHDNKNNCIVDVEATQALNKAVGDLKLVRECKSDLLRDYALETARMFLFDLFEDVDENLPRAMVTKMAHAMVADGVTPLVAGVSAEPEATEACTKGATEAIVTSLWMAQGKSTGAEGGDLAAVERDYIVYLPSIILAFASRVLLKRAGLFLERGHRYAVVGMNGVGKTTLLNRIAARDINGFPEEITVYYVQHEIMEADKELSVIGYMERDMDSIAGSKKKAKANKEKRSEEIRQSLADVGFTEELQNKAVASLSGGWAMRLAIARSMLYKANLLLLDEPTNHLDVDAVKWLQEYLASLTTTTIGLVSHDYDFVNYVSTDIIHLADQKLTYYPCGFKEFQKQRPDIVAALPKKDDDSGGTTALDLLANADTDEKAAELASNIKPINFPEGTKLQGIAHRGKPVASITNVSFSYPGTDKFVFNDVSVRITQNSRVALLGPNGAGKSTLLKLLVGELELEESRGHLGKLWKHHNLRTAYIAQHSMHHLEDHIEMTPCQYIQMRFWEGQDKEASKMITTKLTPQDESTMRQDGEISEIVSRVTRSKKLYYEVKKNGRSEKGDNKDFRSRDELEKMGQTKPHVIKLVRLFDEKLKLADSGVDLRPLTTPEMIKHLLEFGVPADLAQRKIRWMSGGQKSRLVLAAAMWTRPHLIVLDEPTNYLDNESMAALTHALKRFRGGVLLISHHEGFVGAIAKELWHLEDGTVRVEVLKKPGEE